MSPPVPYDATRASLYRPGQADDFFAHVSSGAWHGAALCAELSRLSYADDGEKRRRSLARVALEEQTFLDAEGTQVLIAADAATTFVVFRGTDGPQALLTDLDANQISWEKGGRVHEGFARYLSRVRGPLENLIPSLSGKELVFTGHSLGAAAATLAQSLWPQGRLVALASPRVGDVVFAATVPAERTERFVHCCDLVCQVPPVAMGYMHVATTRYIDRHGVVTTDPSPEVIHRDQSAARRTYLARHAWAFWKNVLAREVADHSAINYVAPLRAAR